MKMKNRSPPGCNKKKELNGMPGVWAPNVRPQQGQELDGEAVWGRFVRKIKCFYHAMMIKKNSLFKDLFSMNNFLLICNPLWLDY